jgi:hypothetical protein
MTLIMVTLMACATQKAEQTAYSTLSVSQVTYDTTLSMLGSLYKQGKITEAQKLAIIKKAAEYKLAHNTAVTAFLKYKESGLLPDEEVYLITLTKATTLLTEYLELIKPYIKQ